MVALNFMARFAPKVEAGSKHQTIRRGDGARFKVGRPLQLYTGQRTPACRKLVDPDPICKGVEPILITPGGGVFVASVRVDAVAMARADGFDGLDAFLAFFFHDDGRPHEPFMGVLVKW